MRQWAVPAIVSILVLGSFGLSQQAFAVDSDGDGVLDDTDNCITIANPTQENSDGTH